MMEQLLASPPSWLNFLLMIVFSAVLLVIVLGFVTYAILAERKVIGYMQGRIGPNRTGGKLGLLQTAADVLKLLIKEDTIPHKADRPLFIIAPVIAFVPSFLILAVIPFTDKLYFSDIGVGLLYYIAISGLSTLGIMAGAWASNNKYALIGGMRAVAQMISYEIPLVMSVIGVILISGSLNLNTIVETQANHFWFILLQPIAFLVFVVAAVAELNRTPFDLAEAESELVSGYHVEYSGFRFAIFMLAEYVYMFAMAALITVLFLGGWHPPFPELLPFLTYIPGALWFALKFSFMIFFFIWLRATLPRLRADHLMEMGWKVLLPIALLNIFVTAIIKELFFK
ncbi:NADH-quinone oxidoreductase subunit NuoH [Bacillus horti]|nr:NADH-quinone oxidoreductase subunit NuoH [Bacillus horti]